MPELPKDLSHLSPEEKRILLQKMLREKSVPQSDGDRENLPQGFVFPAEYLALQEKFQKVEQLDFESIYFIPSEGINSCTTMIGGRRYINYTSYNYIGMSGDPVVSNAAKDAIDTYGTSVSASRLASGERPIHRELERELADFLGVEACLSFIGGYSTNESVVGHLCGPEDLILYDSLIHASVQTGCRLSGAKIRPFPHNNWEALDGILKEHRRNHRQALIVLEGVYSMDGDIPYLPRFIEIKKRHRALLMVDEAHSIGVLGEHGAGIGEYYKVARTDVDIWMGTLSKSFASCGGYIAGSGELISYLKYTTPGFVYSVGMSPPNTAAALAALRLLRKEPHRVDRLRENARLFLTLARSKGLNTGSSEDSAVVPVIMGQSMPCVRLYKELFDRGIYVLPMIYPTVPENSARLRFFISSTHTEEQIRFTIDTLAEAVRGIVS